MDKANWSGLLDDVLKTPGIISEAYSAFHNYSVGNQLLAWSQCASRTIPLGPIATYKKWSELGRQVRKGEKAIALIMPITIKREKENKDPDIFQTFALKNNWFVLSQTDSTDGAEYANEPVIPEWDKSLALSALDISEVPFALSDGNCQGYASGRTIAINPVAALPHKTRFHELAHIVLGHTEESAMHDSERTPRDIREVEAESVAFICCALLGLPGLAESRGYVQSWARDTAISDKTAQRIFGAAEKILKAGRNHA